MVFRSSWIYRVARSSLQSSQVSSRTVEMDPTEDVDMDGVPENADGEAEAMDTAEPELENVAGEAIPTAAAEIPPDEASRSPEIPEQQGSFLNDSRVFGNLGETDEAADFLNECEDTLVEENFDFGIELPEFRPYHDTDPAQRTTRLCIKFIATENFKSYYGKKLLGPFDQKFTAIIGPNGCGKSNTIDALLFVFGFRKAKLRTSKLSELIHNSDNHKECRSAKVAVHFTFMQTTADNEVLPSVDRDFSVGRTITNREKSQYFLDGAHSTAEDIKNKLRQHGVDLDHNRFLILQGEVEQISMMKPACKSEKEESMLDYLEDIIGSIRYRESISKFVEVIAGVQSELEVADAMHHRLRKSLTMLHKDKLKAERFLDREGETFRLKHMLAQLKLHRTKKLLLDVMTKEESTKKKITEAEVHLAELKEKQQSWQSGQSEVTKNVKEIKKKVDNAAADCAECEKQKAAVEADLKNRKTALKRLENELKKAREAKTELLARGTANAAQKAELDEVYPQMEEKVANYRAQFAAAQNEVASATKEYQAKKTKLEADRAIVLKEQQQANRALDSKNLELNSVRVDVIKAEKRVEELQVKLTAAQQQVNVLSQQQEADSIRLRDVRTETASYTRKLTALQARKSSLEGPITANNERLIALRETRRTASVAETRDGAIQELMRCKAQGTIAGIYGRVGDLGAVEQKYQLAISAVAGSGLDRVVVDSVETSKLCVEHLRRSGRGKATLIVLDKIASNPMMRSIDQRAGFPEGLPRLLDFVTVEDPALRPVFYYTLGDTLLAGNLDQCVRVGKTKKTATLNGEISSPNTITGGGNPGSIEIRIGRNVVARSSSAASQAEVTALEETVNRLRGEFDGITRELEETTQQMTALKREEAFLDRRITLAKGDLQNSQALLNTLPADLQEAQNQLEQVQGTSVEEDRLTRELDQLTAALAKVTKRVEAVSADIANVDKEIWKVRAEKVDVSEKKMKKWEGKFEDLKKEMAEINAAVAGKDGALAGNEAVVKRKQDQIEECKTKILDLETRQEDLEKQLIKSTTTAAKAREELADAQSSSTRLRTELEKVEEDLEAIERAIAGLKVKVKELQTLRVKSDQELAVLSPIPASVQAEAAARPYAKPVDFQDLDGAELSQLDYEKVKGEYQELRRWVDKNTVRLGVLAEYADERKKYDEQLKEYRTLKAKFSCATGLQKKMTEQRTEEFMTSFAVIQDKLKKTYHFLTHGGDAELVPVNNVNIFGDGIEFSVRPPNKSWKSISNLSGGEKTLSSLSLIFALHHYKPTPFYIMDEIDAALDYRNVTIVGKYVKDRALDAQFIIVSLRPNMYQQASRHVGIFKVSNVTQVVVLTQAAYAGWQVDRSVPTDQTDDEHKQAKEVVQKKFLRSLFSKTRNLAIDN